MHIIIESFLYWNVFNSHFDGPSQGWQWENQLFTLIAAKALIIEKLFI